MTTGRSDIREGYAVFTQDGEQLGTVKEVRGQYFKVNAPMQRDYWLSSDAVTSASGNRVTLSIDSGRIDEYKAADPMDYEQAETTTTTSAATVGATTAEGGSHQGAYTTTTSTWDQAGPTYRQRWQERYGSSGGRWEDAEPGYRFGHEVASDERYRGREWSDVETNLGTDYEDWGRRQGHHAEGGWDRVRDNAREAWEDVRGRGVHSEQRATGTTTEGERTVQLREEELVARKQEVEAGEIGIRKEVVAEQQEIEVPVRREEVVIERRPVQGRPTSEPIGEGDTIRVPVREEQVEVDKQTVVREEIEVGKREVQDTERVSGTVRREEARIEHEGDVQVRGEGTERARTSDADVTRRDDRTTR